MNKKSKLVLKSLGAMALLFLLFTMGCTKDRVIDDTSAGQVTLSSLPVLGGTTTVEAASAGSELTTVTAVPNSGFVFANWTDNNVIVSTSSSYQFTITDNRNLVANFVPVVAGSFALVLSSSPVAGGTTVGSRSYTAGTSATVTAAANSKYVFVNWTDNGTIVSTSLSYTFTINANKTLVAHFILGTPVVVPVGPTAPNLGTAGDFVILSKTGVTSIGVTKITGDIGVSPVAATAITGFGLILNANGLYSASSLVTGNIYAASYGSTTATKLTTAIGDMETAFTNANGLVAPAPVNELYNGNLSGRTITPGLYKWSTGIMVTSAGMTFEGGPNDTWVLQIAQDMLISSGATITLKGGAQAKNIFFAVSGLADLGVGSNVSGIILSKTLISVKTGAKFTGRLLAQTAVTLDANTIVLP